jgi:hypothetical protein
LEIKNKDTGKKGFEIQNDELFGPVCFITENEKAHKKVRFEITDGKNMSGKEADIILKQEQDQYIFMIQFDKEKIYRDSQHVIREKWAMIVAFIKSQLTFIDPERLKSITVMLPKNTDTSNVRSKKVKLLISLFILLISEKYVVCQKTNGYQVLSREGKVEELYIAKMELSNYLKKQRPSTVKLINLTIGSGTSYNFQELSFLPTYKILQDNYNYAQKEKMASRDNLSETSPGIKPRASYKFDLNLFQSPALSRKQNKRRTKVDVNDLIKMFNIGAEAEESQEESSSKQTISEKEEGNIQPLESPIGLDPAVMEVDQENDPELKSINSKNSKPVESPRILFVADFPPSIPSIFQRDKRRDGSHRASTMIRKTRFSRQIIKRRGTINTMDQGANFDNALDLITKTGISIQKTVSESIKPTTVTLCKISNRLVLVTIRYQNLFVFADFRLDLLSIPPTLRKDISHESFQKFNIKLFVWTNNPLVTSKVQEFTLSEPVYDFFERFGQGKKATRAVTRLILFNRANDQDKIDLQRILQKSISRLFLRKNSMEVR